MRSLFVRWREWWFHKIPFCLLVFALALDEPLTWQTFARLLALIGIVSCVANYGHAINELFDRAEDAKSGKPNLARIFGPFRMSGSAISSAAIALILSQACVGLGGTVLTACALALPAIYSIPPIRLKARRWWGLFADALAAHVYPATLAILLATSGAIWRATTEFLILVVLWSLLAGLRNIILHQLMTAVRDSHSDLRTVVHDLGSERVSRLVLIAILPFEVTALLALIVFSGSSPLTLLVTIFYAWTECAQCALGQKRFSLHTQQVLMCPVLNNGYYLVWGPFAALSGLAAREPVAALFIPVYALLFWQNVLSECKALSRIAHELMPKAVSPADLRDNIGLIKDSGAFDVAWYATQYEDKVLGMDPVEHYCRFGWRSGLDPNQVFSTFGYLAANADIAATQMNPFVHYLRHGISEARLK
jgi:hypothetical protein